MEPGLPEGSGCHWRRLPAPGRRPAEQGQDRLEGGDEVAAKNGESMILLTFSSWDCMSY